MAEKQSRLFHFQSPDGEVTEGIEKHVITFFWVFWIPRVGKLPIVEEMEESLNSGGLLNLSFLDSSSGEAGGKWGK